MTWPLAGEIQLDRAAQADLRGKDALRACCGTGICAAFGGRNWANDFFERLQALAPYTWMVDPAPLPPQGALPELNLTDWQQLKALSQRERELILKVSGFSDKAWGARGVYLGSDLSTADWAAAVDVAIGSFRALALRLAAIPQAGAGPSRNGSTSRRTRRSPMPGRVRLCPYYFVAGEGDAARANLSGVLATICPADKKIIHGMSTAILAPCSA